MLTHKYFRSIILLCLAFLLTLNAQSQKKNQALKEILNADSKLRSFEVNEHLGTPSFIAFNDKALHKKAEATSLIKSYFNLQQTSNEVKQIESTELKSGLTLEKYKHYYKGIVVDHSAYAVLSKAGTILCISAESYVLGADFSTVPVITKEAAMTNALQFVKAKKYAWEADKSATALFNAELFKEYYPDAQLVIAKDIYGSGTAKLAWKLDIYSVEPLGRYNIYIDAINGKMLLRDMIIKHAGEVTARKPTTGNKALRTILPAANLSLSPGNHATADESASGTGYTRYAGVRSIFTTKISIPTGGAPDRNDPRQLLSYSGTNTRTPIVVAENVFILKDMTRGGGIETFDMNGVGGAPISAPGIQDQALSFIDRNVTVGSQNIWKHETTLNSNEDHVRGATSDGTNGANEAENDDIALDAHWGAEVVYDYWKAQHHRFSYDNKNTSIRSFVHYGAAYDNAFWNGSVMTYGDGSGVTSPAGFRPLTSLDVCGHELGHGICSTTANLVYQGESGAMNEALSDIWASCIERFAIENVDPTLKSIYKPFSIGEQISKDPTIPLRRMDDPKLRTDPSTYNGQYWINPTCTPTLANDECGVHTNSGVLNKWFYLMVAGSGVSGSGPDASYATGADKGLRDAGGTTGYNSIPYTVTGLGFVKAETITYLMELMLSPNATYAEARATSINVARILYGQCSPEEKSTTDAWYGINVGAAYAGCTLPTIFANSSATTNRETAGGTDCVRYNDYNVSVQLSVAQTDTSIIHFTSTAATTMEADKFNLSQDTVIFPAGQTGFRTVKLRVFDDAMVDGDRTIAIRINGVSLDTTITFNILEDDKTPSIGGTKTLLSEDFEGFAQGRFDSVTTATNAWKQIYKITPTPVYWSVRKPAAVAVGLQYTSNRAIVELPLATGNALYDQNVAAQLILRTPLIDATGLNTLKVKFTYQAGGEPACSTCDYGQLTYSTDGISFNSFSPAVILYIVPQDSILNYALPAILEGKQFYLGFQWNNDTNAGSSASLTLDNVSVTAKGKNIETVIGATVSEKVNQEIGKPSFFYSVGTGNIISSISNSAAFNYGCITAAVEDSGRNTMKFFAATPSTSPIVGHKIIRMTPATNNPSGAYNITLYFTEAEIAGIESSNGANTNRSNFYIYKTSAIPYTGATAANTIGIKATYTAITGFGGSFSADFTTGFSAFALGGPAALIVLPVSCLDFTAAQNNNVVNLQWTVALETANADSYQVERSSNGVNFDVLSKIPVSLANKGLYSFQDNNIGGLGDVYYRVKQIDKDGKFTYICKIVPLKLLNAKSFSIGNVHPNPVTDISYINVFTSKPITLHADYFNVTGQLINSEIDQLASGSSIVSIKLKSSISGTYLIRFKNEKGELLGTQTFIKK